MNDTTKPILVAASEQPNALTRLFATLSRPRTKLNKVIITLVLSGSSAIAGWIFHQWSDRAKPSILITSVGFAGDGVTAFDLADDLRDAFDATRWTSPPDEPVAYDTLGRKEGEVSHLIDGLQAARDLTVEWNKNTALQWLQRLSVPNSHLSTNAGRNALVQITPKAAPRDSTTNSALVSESDSSPSQHMPTAPQSRAASSDTSALGAREVARSSFLTPREDLDSRSNDLDPVEALFRKQINQDDDIYYNAWRTVHPESRFAKFDASVPRVDFERLQTLLLARKYSEFAVASTISLIRRTNVIPPVPMETVSMYPRLIPVGTITPSKDPNATPSLAWVFPEDQVHVLFEKLPTKSKVLEAMVFVESFARGILPNMIFYNQQFTTDADKGLDDLNKIRSLIRTNLPYYASLSLRVALYNDGSTAVTFRPQFVLATVVGDLPMKIDVGTREKVMTEQSDVDVPNVPYLPLDSDSQYVVIQPHESKNVRLLSSDALGTNGITIYDAYMRGTLRCKLTGTTYKGRKIHSADTVFGINVKEEELAKTGNGHQ